MTRNLTSLEQSGLDVDRFGNVYDVSREFHILFECVDAVELPAACARYARNNPSRARDLIDFIRYEIRSHVALLPSDYGRTVFPLSDERETMLREVIRQITSGSEDHNGNTD